MIPCLYSLDDVYLWLDQCQGAAVPARAALHFETGINRLGLSPEAAPMLARGGGDLARLQPELIMSHLACGDDPASSAEVEQFATPGVVTIDALAGEPHNVAAHWQAVKVLSAVAGADD